MATEAVADGFASGSKTDRKETRNDATRNAGASAAARRWPSARTLVLQSHRWAGLTFGLVLVFMAITGITIAYRPHLEPIVNRDLLTVPACTGRVPLDALAANARAQHPNGEFDYVRLAAGADGAARIPAAQVRISEPGEYQDDIFLNPCTGEVLGQRARYDGWLATLEQLHRFRFVEGGNLVTGTTALLFALILAGGGLYMWWPRVRTWGALKAASRLNPRIKGRDRTLNRHRVIGMYASLIVLSSALTGLPQAFDWYRNGLYWIAGSKPQKAPTVAASPAQSTRAAPAPMEAYWRQVQALAPNAAETLIHFPNARKPATPIEIYEIDKGAPHANARTMIYLDPADAKVLRFTPYAASSAGHKLYFWTLSWHTGMIGPRWLNLLLPLLLLAGAASVPVLAYTGASSFVRRKFRRATSGARLAVQVISKRREADGICTFDLGDPRGNALPKFSAGSHIDVHVGDGLVRQYSLCNDPRETHRYLIGVLRAPDSRGGSAAMHDSIEEGDVLEISEPKNHFPLAHGAKRSLLIAGGIGVTPILCMAERLANTGGDFAMHYCTRSPERTAFLLRIRASSFAERVHFHFDTGEPAQKFDAGALLREAAPGTDLYVCGPGGFMDHVLSTARRNGWPEERLHREYFASEIGPKTSDSEFDVRIASTGRVYRIAKEQSVVAALAEQGIEIPTSCAQGVCGTCLTRVLDGLPDHRDMYQTVAEQARNDQFTPCCSRSKSPVLVLDL